MTTGVPHTVKGSFGAWFPAVDGGLRASWPLVRIVLTPDALVVKVFSERFMSCSIRWSELMSAELYGNSVVLHALMGRDCRVVAPFRSSLADLVAELGRRGVRIDDWRPSQR
jgi:hypothetical protein